MDICFESTQNFARCAYNVSGWLIHMLPQLAIFCLPAFLIYGTIAFLWFCLHKGLGLGDKTSFFGSFLLTFGPLFYEAYRFFVSGHVYTHWDLSSVYAAPCLPAYIVLHVFLYGK